MKGNQGLRVLMFHPHVPSKEVVCFRPVCDRKNILLLIELEGRGGGILIRGLGPERRREKHAGPPDQAGCLRIGATVQPGSWGFRVLRRRERSEIVLDSTCVRNVFRRETQRLSASPALPCSGQPTFLWLLGGLDECQVPQEGWRQAKRKVRMLFLCLPFGQQLSHR